MSGSPPPHRSLHLALAFAAGAVASFAFLPSVWAPPGLLGFVALFHLWSAARGAQGAVRSAAAPGARSAAALGFAFGLGLYGAGVSWVYISLSRFGGMPAPLAAIATLGLCAYLAAFPAAVGALQAGLQASARIPALARQALALPALWTLAEWLREALFTGFPWLAIGYAAPGTPAESLAPLAGGYAAGFALLTACGLAGCALRGEARRLSLALLAALLLAGYALNGLQWTRPVSATTAALLQGNIPQDLKFVPGRYARTLETYARLAEGSTARLVVLPETALPRFLDDIEPEFLARLEAVGRRNKGDVLFGVPVRDRDSGRYWNSVVSLGRSPPQRYDKRHLVPFGEFIPPGFRWVPAILQVPLSDFSRGEADPAPLALAGLRIAPNICYEDAFGPEVRRALGRGAAAANLLVNVSNVAWFGDSLAPAQHLQIARLRALEAGRMHLTATNTGITAAIDRDGRVLARLPQFVEARLELTAIAYEGETPYLRAGDGPVLLACLLIALACAAVARRGPKR